ncbi:MAG TPA: hypothetical protein PLR60_13680 [Syntrophorhabdaceae bacterium]|nr:hypothetical protein [Syntrophorhabdaceae bacterium]
MDKSAAAIMIQAKSLGVAIALTIFFGGLGLLYSTIPGGIVMSIVQIIVIIIAVFTLGLGLILFIPVHIISVIWAIIAIKKYNEKLIANS